MKILKKQPKKQVQPKSLSNEEVREANTYVDNKRRELKLIREDTIEFMNQHSKQRDVLLAEIAQLSKTRRHLLAPLTEIIERTKQNEIDSKKELIKQKENTAKQREGFESIKLTKINLDLKTKDIQNRLSEATKLESDNKQLLEKTIIENQLVAKYKTDMTKLINDELTKLGRLKEVIQERKVMVDIKEKGLVRREEQLAEQNKLLTSRRRALEALKQEYGR